MKRIVLILLTMVYMLSFTEAYQLLKLPVFISHYYEHCEKNPDTTLISFINLHYSGKTKMDSDHDQDMKLPFKSHEHSEVNTIYLPLLGKIEMVHHESCQVNDIPERYSPVLSSYFSDIWQPPRAC